MAGSAWRTDPARACPGRSAKVLWRENDDCIVLFHEDTGRAFALNETAAALWRMLDGTLSVDEITARLAERLSVEPSVAREATLGALDSLQGDGCLDTETQRREPGPDAPAPAGVDVWVEPRIEEIVFAACDCSGGGRGVVRNAECVTSPQQQTSTI
jgi:hypothetical protein